MLYNKQFSLYLDPLKLGSNIMNLSTKLKLLSLSLQLINALEFSYPNSSPDGVPTDRNLKHLVAWNCDLRNSLQFSEFSLMSVQTCANISSQYRRPYEVMGQVVQAKKYEDMSVIECKLVANFYTSYCSYNLISGYRLLDSQGQIMRMNIQLSQSECEKALRTKVLRYTDRTYYGKSNFITIDLSPSCTADGWMTLRGSSNAVQGTCVPETFNLGRNLYSSHVLTMQYSVNVRQIHAVFNTAKRLIRVSEHLILPNNLSGTYFSPTVGNYHWDKIDQGNLTDNHWLEVAYGKVTIYEPTELNSTMPIAIVSANNTGSGLAFSLRETTSLCHSFTCRKAFQTQLQDVFLVVYSIFGQSRWSLDQVSGTEVNRLLNLEATLASVYLSQELRLTSTFERISRELCQRNREVILTNIQQYINKVLIQQDTNEAKGRFFVRDGSVLYSIKCKEQIAWLRSDTTECFEHAPIFYKNSNGDEVKGFVDPITYIIQPHSSPKPCNDILPYKFNLIALDGTSEWICRNSQGWNIDCKHPHTLSPMHPGTLYVTDDKVILSTLYSKSQLESLEDMQWDHKEKQVDLHEWEIYLQKVKESNPNISTMTYFENLKEAIDSVSDILSSSFWMKLALKHFLPIILLNYIVNVMLNMLKALFYIKRIYQAEGLTMSLVAKACIAAVASLFPVFALSAFNKEPAKVCNCESPGFVDDLVKTLENRDRQRFLRNLEL